MTSPHPAHARLLRAVATAALAVLLIAPAASAQARPADPAGAPNASARPPSPASPHSAHAKRKAAPRKARVQTTISLINQARSKARTCGTKRYRAAPPVTGHRRLALAANRHARAMATRNFFSHDSLNGRSAGQRIDAAGYRWSTWGENIAAGYSTPADVVKGWVNSPGHCANLMSRSYTEVGLGYAYGPRSTYKHYWVLDLGDRR